MSYPKTGEEVYVSLNLSNTMLTGLGKGTITREDVSVDYLKKLFMQHGVIVSAKPEYRNIMERVNSTYDLGLEIPAKLQLFQLSEQHRRLVVVNISGLQRKNGSLLPSYTEEELDVRQVLRAGRALRRACRGEQEAALRARAGDLLEKPHGFRGLSSQHLTSKKEEVPDGNLFLF